MDDLQALPDVSGNHALQTEIPDKLFFRIGEVSQLIGVEAYVLRYWESEFKPLAPRKSSTGQRMFRKKDVELLLRIKHLLYERKFTIEGARQWLAQHPKQDHVVAKSTATLDSSDPLPGIRREVAEILKLLGS